MLDKSDNDTVRDWLLLALAAAETEGKTAADLAAWCNVSPQAVNGWKKTGRITKSNLERAALFFGSGPSFTRHAVSAAHEASTAGWPFPDIDARRFSGLTPNQKIEIQGVVRDRIERFESMAREKAPAAKATRRRRAPT